MITPTQHERLENIRAAADEIADKWFAHELPIEASLHSNPKSQLRELAVSVITRHCAPANEVEQAHCWHCGVILACKPIFRCEDCPDECDDEECRAWHREQQG